VIDRDHEGFLRNPKDWDPKVAIAIAADLGVELGPDHQEIIQLLRQYYSTFGLSPPSRVLLKLVQRDIDPTFSSIQLMKLFGGRARRNLAQIAGLPKPRDCD